jgi:hypothetical protein
MGHALMENRSDLIVEACLTEASGHAERVAALAMIEPRADRPGRIYNALLMVPKSTEESL